ncbi:DNA polymerase I [Thiothrix fructosivorans]|uniref:DNA polymerase I n=1 Tax=Thiothrix fructosivorans TaxID=111770 RepID=A0A8B0SND6_9GAMM|nr:DNA polymerase I [Thiothrix fructosivorans]MBO0612055.1 DNA polymerase I [Thiothrix fructosivorans]QTX12444.1 DNA polymerase I [Thiothrix fructosivorans]
MTHNSTKPLVLVDGSSYLFRAFHALPPLTNVHGEPTGAMHGVLNMLDKLRKDYNPDHMAVIFDAPGKTFRDDLYPQYKATRPPMPEDLRCQIEPLLTIIRAQGYPLLIIPDVEADDVIGTLAQEYAGKVIISTGDKDMAQLVDERVHLINTMSGHYADPAGVLEKFGVAPERIRDYLTLIGDSVDNVPGVNKVGPKTAVKWLQEYGSLENIMAHADEFKGKIGDYLREALAHLPLSYELVTIKCDVALDLQPETLAFNPEDTETLRELYERYGLRTRLAALGSAVTPHPNLPPQGVKEQEGVTGDLFAPCPPCGGRAGEGGKSSGNAAYTCILTQPDLDTWLHRLQAAGEFAFDTETTSLNYMEAEIVGVSFAIQPGEAAYLPLAHDYLGAPPQLNREAVLAQLKPLLEDPTLRKIGQNLKYDRSVLLNHGIELRGIAHDTMLESYVLDSTASRHDMDTLCAKHLNHTNISFADIAGKGKNQLTFNQVGLEEATPYAAEDADMTLQLHQYFWAQLQALDAQRKLYEAVEVPLVSVLSDIERNGVKVDATLLAIHSKELETRMHTVILQAYEAAGQEFNLASPKQLGEILYTKLGLTAPRKTPKGQPSTAEDVLEELAEMGHELPALILVHRGLAKLKSTYTDKLPEQINPRTGRVHTSYHQAVASTGRLSSSDPNLQNIPIRTEEGRRIRQAFVAEAGCKLLAADYSQIELRIMAHLSGDQGLLDAFAQGLDVHRATAAEVFGVVLDEVTTEQRRAAKAINFGLIYGMSTFGLAKQLGVDRKDAQAYVNLYFARYPGVKQYMDDTREQARAQGYVETLFGRRLFLPDIKSKNAATRQYAERTAINAPMQGTAADIIKKAMLAVAAWLRDSGLHTKMIMQVHDELVFEVPEAELDTVRAQVIALMTNAVTLAVPLVVDTGVGANWDEAH